jgi:hypothetical protein
MTMPSEIEKLRALLADARNLLSLDCWSGRCCTMRARIDAALAEPMENWTQAAEIQEQFKLAAMKERDEARAKLALLERHYSPEAAAKLRAELAAANAEIASLRWGNEMACENTPTKECGCPGCGLARERAERGEV